jgi:hypothetical protein
MYKEGTKLLCIQDVKPQEFAPYKGYFLKGKIYTIKRIYKSLVTGDEWYIITGENVHNLHDHHVDIMLIKENFVIDRESKLRRILK